MSLGEVLRTGLGREHSELGLPVLDVEGEGWISDRWSISPTDEDCPDRYSGTFQGKCALQQGVPPGWRTSRSSAWVGARGRHGTGQNDSVDNSFIT